MPSPLRCRARTGRAPPVPGTALAILLAILCIGQPTDRLRALGAAGALRDGPAALR